MREVLLHSRRRSLPSVLGLLTASVLCLCGGGLLAVAHEGLPRLLFGAGGFAGYVFFFAHALRELGLPSVLIEGRPAPDGEVQREPDRNHVLTAAA
jgi:hypothetical protein